MSAWPGKFVIGLTGNIATGKSVVRKMLEHLGAQGIDADALAHRAMAKGAPGYQAVVDIFGKWVVGADGQIDREKLGRLTFADPEAMAQLEAVIHPLVGQALDILIRRSPQQVVVIAAIQLIDAGLAAKCDAGGVTYTPPELQLARLMQKRGMSEAAARQRIEAQTPQEKKTAAAKMVIRNDGSFEDTWQQVYIAWQRQFPAVEPEPEPVVTTTAGEFLVQRARPKEAQEIAELINQLSGGQRSVTRSDIMAAFGEKAFMIVKVDNKTTGVVGWRVENLVACTDDVYLDSSVPFVDMLRPLMDEVERASRELQCEASLMFLPTSYHRFEAMFRELGYQQRTVDELGVRAWEEAAVESMPPDSVMFFKQLRQDRVLKPV